MKKNLFLIIFLNIFQFSCDKENDNNSIDVDCDQLRSGLVEYNEQVVLTEFLKLTTDLYPNQTNDDNIGHKSNFDLLIERINICGDISAELLCYACILTYPGQTEISVIVDSSGVSVERILDILTPEDNNLEFKGIHHD